MVRIRLKRTGAKNDPQYRIVVADNRCRRDGRFIEEVGHYHPQLKDKDKEFLINLDRVDYWLKQGAKPSETVASIIRRARKAVKV